MSEVNPAFQVLILAVFFLGLWKAVEVAWRLIKFARRFISGPVETIDEAREKLKKLASKGRGKLGSRLPKKKSASK